MGILREKPEHIDSLYMAWIIGDGTNDLKDMTEGFEVLTPEIGPSFKEYAYDMGKNSRDKIIRDTYFDDKNYFETFTNCFGRGPYRI